MKTQMISTFEVITPERTESELVLQNRLAETFNFYGYEVRISPRGTINTVSPDLVAENEKNKIFIEAKWLPTSYGRSQSLRILQSVYEKIKPYIIENKNKNKNNHFFLVSSGLTPVVINEEDGIKVNALNINEFLNFIKTI